MCIICRTADEIRQTANPLMGIEAPKTLMVGDWFPVDLFASITEAFNVVSYILYLNRLQKLCIELTRLVLSTGSEKAKGKLRSDRVVLLNLAGINIFTIIPFDQLELALEKVRM